MCDQFTGAACLLFLELRPRLEAAYDAIGEGPRSRIGRLTSQDAAALLPLLRATLALCEAEVAVRVAEPSEVEGSRDPALQQDAASQLLFEEEGDLGSAPSSPMLFSSDEEL
jgi:hypothetical protein